MANDYLLYECSSFLLLDKPHNMPTVPLKTQNLEGTLLEQAALVSSEVLKVIGKNPWEGGALHRLDTATAGIVLFAKKQNFYDELQRLQEGKLFEKYYLASTFENNSLKGLDIEEKHGIVNISSYFRPFGPGAKEVRPTLDEKKASPKTLYTTNVIREQNQFYCTITKGFRHQIRAHLAWTGHPILGDEVYGASSLLWGDQEPLQLECVGITLPLSSAPIRFLKGKASKLPFASLYRFANENENVIILP